MNGYEYTNHLDIREGINVFVDKLKKEGVILSKYNKYNNVRN